MTIITLKLPEALVERAGGAARAMHRPLEDVLAAMLEGVLPALEDVPADMQAELVEMTWWDDAALMAAARGLRVRSHERATRGLRVRSHIEHPAGLVYGVR